MTVEELAQGAAQTGLFGPGASLAAPWWTVGLDGPPPVPNVVERAVARAEESDRLLVGVCQGRPHPALDPLVSALDLTLVRDETDRPWTVAVPDPVAAAEALGERVAWQPQAALVLGALLRDTAGLPVRQALDAESLAYSTLLGGGGFANWFAARGHRTPAPATGRDPVLVRHDGDTLRLTLNLPERRNAHGARIRDALVDALFLAELDDSVKSVVLNGAGPVFCSGSDFAEFGAATDLATAHLVRTRAGAARPLHALRDRITARVHGHCVGAGVELPAFGSRVVADPATLFRLPELEMGLIPGVGGTVSLPRRIGRWRTLYLALGGRALDAGTALRWGLVDAVEPVRPAG
ncbi:enoyl-CoA hydratase/isomerase family protein [Streptomyces daliensis]